MAILSQRAYARYRGVALSAVQKAISTNRISTQPDGSIDSEQADFEWRQNTMPHAPAGAKHEHEDDGSGSQYRKSRAVREHYQARLAKLEYGQRNGDLVRKDEVEMATFNLFRQFREHMLNIPNRVAATLAAESDAANCFEILNREIQTALHEFAGANGDKSI